MNEIEMYKSGMSLNDVSAKTGVPVSTLRRSLKKAGVLRGRAEAIRLAGKDGKLGGGMRGVKRVFTEEWKENISKAKLGKGKGLSLKPNGYIEITVGENKGRGQHVVIMESCIGRRLFSNECVHHIDHNRSNNDKSNLQLMTRSDHARLHAIENINKRERQPNGRLK